MISRVAALLPMLVPRPLRRLFEGFWVVPMLLALSGVAAAAVVQFLPRDVMAPVVLDALASIDPEGARGALSVVAAGVMSVASIVFSLTFVALSITAQQLSPRMLDFVLRDRALQLLIGVALATFLFASIALTFGAGRDAWRLALAAPVALTLAAVALATVVAFAHRMTRVMRPDEMVAQRGTAFVRAMAAIAAVPPGCAAASSPQVVVMRRTLGAARPLRVTGAGYVGAIDGTVLMDLAVHNDARLWISVRPNAFLAPGMVFGRADGLDPDEDAKVVAVLGLTDRRTLADPASYEAQALSEAAIRALSPGINDPATALACIDRLFEGAFVVALGGPVPEGLCDSKGSARLLRAPFGLRALLDEAIIPIMHYGSGDPRIGEQLKRLAAHLHAVAPRTGDREVLAAFLERLRGAGGA